MLAHALGKQAGFREWLARVKSDYGPAVAFMRRAFAAGSKSQPTSTPAPRTPQRARLRDLHTQYGLGPDIYQERWVPSSQSSNYVARGWQRPGEVLSARENAK